MPHAFPKMASFHDELEKIALHPVAREALIGGLLGTTLGGAAGFAKSRFDKPEERRTGRDIALGALAAGSTGALLGAAHGYFKKPPVEAVGQHGWQLEQHAGPSSVDRDLQDRIPGFEGNRRGATGTRAGGIADEAAQSRQRFDRMRSYTQHMPEHVTDIPKENRGKFIHEMLDAIINVPEHEFESHLQQLRVKHGAPAVRVPTPVRPPAAAPVGTPRPGDLPTSPNRRTWPSSTEEMQEALQDKTRIWEF